MKNTVLPMMERIAGGIDKAATTMKRSVILMLRRYAVFGNICSIIDIFCFLLHVCKNSQGLHAP